VDAESEATTGAAGRGVNREKHDVGYFRGCGSGRTGSSRNSRNLNLNGDLNVPGGGDVGSRRVAVSCVLLIKVVVSWVWFGPTFHRMDGAGNKAAAVAVMVKLESPALAVWRTQKHQLGG